MQHVFSTELGAAKIEDYVTVVFCLYEIYSITFSLIGFHGQGLPKRDSGFHCSLQVWGVERRSGYVGGMCISGLLEASSYDQVIHTQSTS